METSTSSVLQGGNTSESDEPELVEIWEAADVDARARAFRAGGGAGYGGGGGGGYGKGASYEGATREERPRHPTQSRGRSRSPQHRSSSRSSSRSPSRSRSLSSSRSGSPRPILSMTDAQVEALLPPEMQFGMFRDMPEPETSSPMTDAQVEDQLPAVMQDLGIPPLKARRPSDAPAAAAAPLVAAVPPKVEQSENKKRSKTKYSKRRKSTRRKSTRRKSKNIRRIRRSYRKRGGSSDEEMGSYTQVNLNSPKMRRKARGMLSPTEENAVGRWTPVKYRDPNQRAATEAFLNRKRDDDVQVVPLEYKTTAQSSPTPVGRRTPQQKSLQEQLAEAEKIARKAEGPESPMGKLIMSKEDPATLAQTSSGVSTTPRRELFETPQQANVEPAPSSRRMARARFQDHQSSCSHK